VAAKKTKAPKRRSTLTLAALRMAGGRPRAGAKSGGSLKRRAVAPGEVVRVALWLDRDLALALRQRAAVDEINLSVAVEAALRAWLAGVQ